MQVIGVNHILVSSPYRLMPFLYADLYFPYMSKIGPDHGLPADFHILQDAIDLLFNSSISSSHQNLKKFFLRKGTAKFEPNKRPLMILW